MAFQDPGHGMSRKDIRNQAAILLRDGNAVQT